MYHIAYIRLVYTHAERYCSHYNINLLHDEGILRLAAGGSLHTGMVCHGRYVIGLQDLGQFLNLLAGKAVDDPWLAGIGLYEFDDVLVNILGLGPYLIVQVGTVERWFEILGILYSQVFLNVVTDFIGSSSGKRYDRSQTYLLYDIPYLAVLRAEIMSPLRNTVSLINSVKRYLDLLEEINILLLGKRLRSHIQKFGFAVKYIGLNQIDWCLI